MTHCPTECKDKHEPDHEADYYTPMPGIPEGLIDHGVSPTDNLIAGEFPHVKKLVTITGGELLPRGAVLGRIHADDHCQGEDRYRFLSNHDCKDGSAMPDAILAQTVDTRCGDQQAYVYLSGEFFASQTYLPQHASQEEVAHILRKRSIFLC